jgi:DNA-binding CsgD family transcriptional regulator/Tfp pilus assembly protein PilE
MDKINSESTLIRAKLYTFIIISIFILITYVSYQLALKKIKRFKNEKNLIEKRKLIVERELDIKNLAMNDLIHSLQNKDKLLRHYQGILDNPLGYFKSDKEPSEREEDYEKMIHSTILTDDQWQSFKKTFSSVYPYFIINLNSAKCQLTEGEIRHACLLRLNLTAHQIANIIGVSRDSIRKSNQRLRQKLGFSIQTDLIEYIFKIPAQKNETNTDMKSN